MQIIPTAQTFGSQLGSNLGQGLGSGFAQQMQRGLEARQAQKQNFQQQLQDEQGYEIVKNNFGEKFADIWKTAPQGGKTELLKAALEMKQRGLNIEEMIGGMQGPGEVVETFQVEEEPSLKNLTQKEKVKERRALREEAGKVIAPLQKEMNEMRKNIPLQEKAIADIEESIPDVGAMDYFAELTGLEPLRTEKGARLKTALKDFFLTDLSRAGARPNQWIEQQLADALPKIGRSFEANQTVAAGMKFKVDLAKERLEIYDELSEQDEEKYGYIRKDIDKRVYRRMKSYVEERQKELKKEIEDIKSGKKIPVEKGTVSLSFKDQNGNTYANIPREDLEAFMQEASSQGLKLEAL